MGMFCFVEGGSRETIYVKFGREIECNFTFDDTTEIQINLQLYKNK